jgi:hypothetical protein
MPNLVKYSTTNVNNSIKKGNVSIGINIGDYGPTDSTGFWNGITPTISGYTVYILPSGQTTPSIVCPPDDTDLVYWIKSLGGTVTNATEALTYVNSTLPNVLVANRDYPNIATNGLVSCIDGGYTGSYTRQTGGISYDLSGNNNRVQLTLANYDSSSGGSIQFGQNKFGTHTFSSAPFNGDFTFNIIFKHTNGFSFTNWDFLYTVNAFGVGFTVTTFLDKPRINYGQWFTDVLDTSSFSALTVGQNYMMTVIKSSNVFSCYVNAVSYGVGSTTTTSITLSNFRIGCGPSANIGVEYWVGNIYVINIYNRAISPSEVTSLYDGYKTIYNI